jgi:hypothetical protein
MLDSCFLWGPSVSKLGLTIVKNPQFLTTWTPWCCLSVLATWLLASPGGSHPQGQGKSCNVFYNLILAATHCHSAVFYCHAGQPY